MKCLRKIAFFLFSCIVMSGMFGNVHAQGKFTLFPFEALRAWQSQQDVSATSPINVLHYDVYLNIEPKSQTISGKTHLSFYITDPTARSFSLDFRLNLDSLFINNQRLTPVVTSDRIIISPSPQFPAFFGILALDVYYHGRPGNDGFGGFFFANQYTFTVGEGLNTYPPSMLRYWIPSHDVPDDKATWDLHITVPKPLKAISNGLLISSNPSDEVGTITYHWRESHPMATYLVAIAIGDYASFSQNYTLQSGATIPLEFYSYPEHLQLAKTDWADVGRMIDFFESKFGPYPFDRYSMVEVPMRGAMEHQTMTSYASGLVTGDHRYDYVVAHELAHQWWGDWVTLADWRDIWLNEGFASYCEALYFESLGGQQTLQNYMTGMATEYFTEAARLGAFALYDPKYMWGATVYQKGAWVLHMLRWTIGDSLFWRSLQAYGEAHAYGNATTEDFITVVEKVCKLDLRWFFDQWVYGSGYPDLDAGWEITRTEDDAYQVDLTVWQRGSTSEPFSLPMEILVQTAAGAVMDTLLLDQRSQSFTLLYNERPSALTIDPNGWLLKKLDMTSQPLPPGFAADEFGLAQNYPNPFTPERDGNETAIMVQIGTKDSPAMVSLKIYDLLGREVRTLVNKKLTAGMHLYLWDGKDDQNKQMPSGVYLYQMKAGDRVVTKRMSLLRR